MVNVLDAAILAANWGYNANAEATAVPEPTVLAMLACLILLAGARRRRSTPGRLSAVTGRVRAQEPRQGP